MSMMSSLMSTDFVLIGQGFTDAFGRQWTSRHQFPGFSLENLLHRENPKNSLFMSMMSNPKENRLGVFRRDCFDQRGMLFKANRTRTASGSAPRPSVK